MKTYYSGFCLGFKKLLKCAENTKHNSMEVNGKRLTRCSLQTIGISEDMREVK